MDNLELTEKQKDAFKIIWKSDKPCIWAGSIRSGKTFAGAFIFTIKAAHVADDYIIAGRTYTSAKRNIIKYVDEIAEYLDLRHKFHRADGFYAIEDSKLWIFGGNDESAQDKVQGMTARGMMLDEVLLMPKSFVMQCIARCSQPDPLILMTLNKGDPAHWVKRELIDEGVVTLIESKLDDNPHIGGHARRMYDDMFSGHYHARMVENVWTSATGAVFPPLAETDPIQDYRQTVVSCDGSQSGTHAALLIKKENVKGDHWQVSNEYYSDQEANPKVHAERMFELDPSATFVVDPSAANLKRELRKLGCYVVNADNNVEKGIQWTQSAIRRRVVTLNKNRVAPNLVAEIAGYVWDERASERGEDKPIKYKDHACDCLRYFVMYCCPPPEMSPIMKPSYL